MAEMDWSEMTLVKEGEGDTSSTNGLIDSDARYGELGQITNKDGSISTEYSVTENIPELGGWVNIPTLVKGQVDTSFLEGGDLTDAQLDIAINRAIERKKGGATLPSFSSMEEAVSAAQSRKEEDKMRPYQTAPDGLDWSEMTPIYENATERLDGRINTTGDITGEVIKRKREQGASDEDIEEALDLFLEMRAQGKSPREELLNRGINLDKKDASELAKEAKAKEKSNGS